MLVSSFLAGLLGSLSPCIYPLIPVTLSVLGLRRHQSYWHSLGVSATYVAGMVLLYTTLGIIFSYVGFVAGSALQSPWLNACLAILMLVLASNLLGLFNWGFPASWNKKLTQLGHHGKHRNAFLMGLVAGIIAAPCTGPILATILTLIAEKHDLRQGVLLMFAYALGMGLPFLILGTFSSLIHKIPKSGPWMGRIKFILGLLMLLVGFYYAQLAFNGFHRQQRISQNIATQIQHAKTQNKRVILDFWADWCTLCHELDNVTFKDPKVQEALRNYTVIKVDVSVDSEETQALQETYGVVGLPTLVFIDSNKKINGFISAEDFIKLLIL